MVLTMVRLPLCAPQILVYATTADPSRQPHTAIIVLSTNPKLKSNGPRSPTARLFAVMFALNQRMAMCTYPNAEPAWRSSGITRVMPRASRPARLSIRVFQYLNERGTGTAGLGVLSKEAASLSRESLLGDRLMPSVAAVFSTSAPGRCVPWPWWCGFMGSMLCEPGCQWILRV